MGESVSNVQLSADQRAGWREWSGLAVLALATLLLAIDNTVLFLALPHLSADLRPTQTEQLWIMDAYGFMIAGFLVTMGALGDRIGHRRLLLIGAVAFASASVLAAYSPSAEMLIFARAVLGIAGATLMPSALALIANLFKDPRQRAFAVGVFVSCFMGGAALGPVAGGILLESFWWGSVFLLGVPVMVLLLATGPRLLPESRATTVGRPDLASVVLSLAAILPIIYGLKEVAAEGMRWPAVLIAATGIAVGWAFVRRQRRLTDPLLDLRLFGNRSFTAALVILLLVMVLQGGIYLLASQYLQLVEGLSPSRAGLWLVPPAIALVAGSLLAPVIARTVRPGTVIGSGLAISAIGFALLTQVDHEGGTALLIGGIVIGFLGTAPVGALGIDLIVGSAPAEKAGSASSMAETSGELGSALGIAALGSVSAVVYRDQIAGEVPAGVPDEAAEAGRDTLAGAVTEANELPPGLAAQLLEPAREAFTAGLAAVGGVSAVAVAGLAIVALIALRSHQAPNPVDRDPRTNAYEVRE